MTKKPVKKPAAKPVKRAAKKAAPPQPTPVKDDPIVVKKLMAQAKKLARQQKIVAAADAAEPKRSKPTPIRTVTCTDCGVAFKSTNPDASTCTKCDRGAKPAKRVKDDVDTPRIEARLIVGDLSVPVDASDLAHTLGAANYVGKGLIDAWPDTVWSALLSYLGLPAFPLDRATADQPVKRLVQRLWYDACRGGYPEESRKLMEERDEERIEEYKENFEKVKEAVEVKVERAKKAFGGVHKVSTYAGKKIKVLNKNHGARPGTKRAIGMDIIIASKTTDEALPLLVKAGCNASFIAFAIAQGFVELA